MTSQSIGSAPCTRIGPIRLGTCAILSGACLLLLLPGPLRAQAVVGEVRDASSSSPIEGAFVVLLDEAGDRVTGSLSDPSGAFRLQAPAAGRYRVHADRIGYEGQSSALLELPVGDPHPLALRLAERAFS